jgi:hypothetical protein
MIRQWMTSRRRMIPIALFLILASSPHNISTAPFRFLIVLCLLILGCTVTGGPTRTIITAEADADVSEGGLGSEERVELLGDEAYGVLHVGTGFDGRRLNPVISYFRFDLGSVPDSTSLEKVNIESAQLSLFAQSRFSRDKFFVTVHYCPDNGWSEDTITWNNRVCPDDPRGEDSIIIDLADLPNVYRWDVTKGVAEAVASGFPKVTFTVTSFPSDFPPEARNVFPSEDSRGFVRFWSREKSDFGLSAQPTLVVTTSVSPTPWSTFLFSTLPALAALVAILGAFFAAYRRISTKVAR